MTTGNATDIHDTSTVYQCQCGQYLLSHALARRHVAVGAVGDHAYSAVVHCDHCGGDLGDGPIVFMDGVYCGAACVDAVETARQEHADRLRPSNSGHGHLTEDAR